MFDGAPRGNNSLHGPISAVPQAGVTIWVLPPVGVLKFNIDGASKGNLGLAGVEEVLRDNGDNILMFFSNPVGIMDAISAEVLAINEAFLLFSASKWANSHELWIECDCKNAVLWSLNPSDAPWKLRKWLNVVEALKLKIAALAPNIPALYELHFAVPMAGAILSALNIMLDSATLAEILEKLEPKFIFVDYQYVHAVHKALEILTNKMDKHPLLVLIEEYDHQATTLMSNYEFASGSMKYSDLLGMGGTDFETVKPKDEGDPISVNFTSGSTGEPKGVLYSHRAAYLNSLASIMRYDMRVGAPVFLWTVDMFRCNGWCCT
ncbi:hypothetical protein REPUB_Repub10bG0185600 [Reevesia pubescens]